MQRDIFVCREKAFPGRDFCRLEAFGGAVLRRREAGEGRFLKKNFDFMSLRVSSFAFRAVKKVKKYFGGLENGCIFASAFVEKRGLLKSRGPEG